MIEEPQGQGGLDGEIRVAPLPTPPAAPAGRPGSDRVRGYPHRHIAASNEGLIVGRPVRHAILCLIPGMNLRLHPRSVAPAEGPEKCGPRRPTRSGYSCNNAAQWRWVRVILIHAHASPRALFQSRPFADGFDQVSDRAETNRRSSSETCGFNTPCNHDRNYTPCSAVFFNPEGAENLFFVPTHDGCLC